MPSSAPLYRESSDFADDGGPREACGEFQKWVLSGGARVSNCAAFPAPARKPMLLCLQMESKRILPLSCTKSQTFDTFYEKINTQKTPFQEITLKFLFFSLPSTLLAGKGSGRATAPLQTNQPAPFPSPL